MQSVTYYQLVYGFLCVDVPLKNYSFTSNENDAAPGEYKGLDAAAVS